MAEETASKGHFSFLGVLVGLGVIATGVLYFQVKRATITVYSDGSIDASLGNQKLTDKNWVVNGVLELKTWNGYLLQIFIPTTVSLPTNIPKEARNVLPQLGVGNISYQYSKDGKILSSGTNITTTTSDNYVTINFAK